MSGLLTNLITSAQTLDAQQLGITVTGKNLANVNNPAYARETVNLSAVGPGGTLAMGVSATSVESIRDALLDEQVTQAASQTGYLQAQSDNLTSAQTALGESIDSSTSASSLTDTGSGTTGISADLNNFFNAFSNLSANPTDATAKQDVIEAANVLTSDFNNTDSQLSTLQGDITTQATSDVSTVNGLLSNIATLNGQIASANANDPSSALDLEDQRQSDLEQLASYMNFTTATDPNGSGQIQVIAQDASSNPVILVNQTTVEGNGLTFDGTNFSGGGSSTQLSLTGGSLAGEIDARDGAIQQLRESLATTSSQLTTAVNAAYNPTSSSTGNFFQSTPSSGLIVVDPNVTVSNLKTTATSNVGANDIALAVSNVANQTFSTSGGDLINGTITGYYAQTVSGLGSSVQNASTQLTDQQSIQTMLTTQRDSVSGVSEDEELSNLMQYQRAFQASSQVVSVVDNLLDVVINQLIGASTT